MRLWDDDHWSTMGLIFSNVPLFINSDNVASFLRGSFIKFLCVLSRTLFMESISAF